MTAIQRKIRDIENCETIYELTFLWFVMDKSNLYERERLLDARAMQLLLFDAQSILSKCKA
jgi:hypothetical protein